MSHVVHMPVWMFCAAVLLCSIVLEVIATCVRRWLTFTRYEISRDGGPAWEKSLGDVARDHDALTVGAAQSLRPGERAEIIEDGTKLVVRRLR